MTTKITIAIQDGPKLEAELNDSRTAQALIELLPVEFPMQRWGEEFYGDCGIDAELADDARDLMEIGELAVWPAAHALCIFFGPTPASEGDEPRAVGPVNPVGHLLGDAKRLKEPAPLIRVKISAR